MGGSTTLSCGCTFQYGEDYEELGMFFKTEECIWDLGFVPSFASATYCRKCYDRMWELYPDDCFKTYEEAYAWLISKDEKENP